MTQQEKDKKKLLVLGLLLFVVVGLTGYGVYSYFFTEGNFSGYGSTVEIAAFNPETTIRGNTNFLGSGGTAIITCPNSDGDNETITCTGSVLVSNNGDRDITVEVLDAESGKNLISSSNESENFDQEIVVSSPSFSWNTTTIEAGDSVTLNISVPVQLTNNFGSSALVDAGSNAQGIDEYWAVEVAFKLKATQVH